MTDDRYVSEPVHIAAKQFTGSNEKEIRDWLTPSAPADQIIAALTPNPGNWVARFPDGGHQTMTNDEFLSVYNPTDEQASHVITVNMPMTNGDHARVSVTGWRHGSSAVWAMLQMGNPDFVTSFIRERVDAGDMSMIEVMDKFAEVANPGE